MNVLAFDTCLGAVSAAVGYRAAGGPELRDIYEICPSGHAERLFPMIAEVMHAAGLGFGDLDRIAVTVGPGSFTGVRVGVAAARALALATGKPVVAVSSLAVIAQVAEEMLAEPLGARHLTVAVDARRGALYVQSFGAGAEQMDEPAELTPQDAAQRIGRQGTIVVGSGAARVAELAQQMGGDAEPRFPDLQPRARGLAVMAPRLAPVDRVKPLYLRQPDVRPQEQAALARARA